MGGFRSAQVGFRLPWAGVGPLVLVGGRGFARHGPPRVLGLVVVAENGSVLGFYLFIYLFIYHLGLWVWIWQWWMLMVVVAADGLEFGFCLGVLSFSMGLGFCLSLGLTLGGVFLVVICGCCGWWCG